MRNLYKILVFVVLLLLAFGRGALAKGPNRATAGLQAGSHEVQKPLQVTGQSRNLSMMLVLKSEKDRVRFVEVRRSYRGEVLKTDY